jgi:hypothetical protein
MTFGDINPALFALQAFLLALAASYVTRRTMKGDDKAISRASEGVSSVLINIFLPLLVLEALVNNIDNIALYMVHFILGFGVAFALYTSVGLIFRRSNTDLKYTNLIVSTFGGGNRGVALMSLIVVIMSGTSMVKAERGYDELLAAFIILDLGNFFFFLAALPILVRKAAKRNNLELGETSNGMTDILSVFGPYAFAISIPIALYFSFAQSVNPNLGNDWVAEILDSSKEGRRFMILFLSTYYIFLRFKINFDALKSSFSLCAVFVTFRLLAISIVFFVFYFLSSGSVIDAINLVANSIIGLPLVVLLLCPPSSLLPALLNGLGFSGGKTQNIDNSIGILGLLFYIVLFIFGLVFPIASVLISWQ